MPIPFILGALIASKAVSTVSDIFGQRKQAGIYEREGEMERELYGKNTEMAETLAEDATARGYEAEQRLRYKQRTLTGAQNSAFAGQGITAGVGTAGFLTASDRALVNQDITAARENAQREAFGYRQQADVYRSQGALAYTAGRNKAKATRNQVWGSLANFGGDMFGLYQGRK